MKYVFWSYKNPEYLEALQEEMGHMDGFVEIKDGDILSEPAEAIVSPANSFGYMDGGLDLVYRNHFGKELEWSVISRIRDYWNGELLVGEAFTVVTGHHFIPKLVVAPTMRTPMKLRPVDPNVYLAMKAIVMETRLWEGRIGVPGLGIGVGQFPPKLAAKHMRLALERYYPDSENRWFPSCFRDACLPGDLRSWYGDEEGKVWLPEQKF